MTTPTTGPCSGPHAPRVCASATADASLVHSSATPSTSCASAAATHSTASATPPSEGQPGGRRGSDAKLAAALKPLTLRRYPPDLCSTCTPT